MNFTAPSLFLSNLCNIGLKYYTLTGISNNNNIASSSSAVRIPLLLTSNYLKSFVKYFSSPTPLVFWHIFLLISFIIDYTSAYSTSGISRSLIL